MKIMCTIEVTENKAENPMMLLIELLAGPDMPQPPRQIHRTRITLGRSSENDWVLSDDQKELSRHHCYIEWRGTGYFLCDSSANGVFVNDARERLGNGHSHLLAAGDEFAVGPHRFRVDLVDVNTRTAPMSTLAEAPPPAEQPIAAERTGQLANRTAQNPVAAERTGQNPTAANRTAQNPALTAEIPLVDSLGDATSQTAASQTAASQTAASQTVPQRAATALDDEAALSAEELLAAFQRGAGLGRLPTLPPAQMMERAGLMLRLSLRGAMEVLMARGNIKSTLGVDKTLMQAVRNNPLKVYPPTAVDDVLLLLLGAPNPAYLPAVEAVREGFDDIRIHQVAILAGIQAALQQLVHRFDPQELQQHLAQPGWFDGLIPHRREARYWQAFNALYAQLADEVREDFSRALNDFAAAYEEQEQQRQTSRP